MRNSCPVCNSTNVYRLHAARRIGSTVGAVGGAATGAGGVFSCPQTGAAVGAVGTLLGGLAKLELPVRRQISLG